jgi:Ca2+-binding RTX toxin-like protein
MLGGKENDTIRGGEGHDWISGGMKFDRLIGDAGYDILIGGLNADQFNPTSSGKAYGSDLLIGGSTTWDNNRAAMQAIMAVWSSSMSYTARIQALSVDGVGSTKQYKLNKTTVIEDNAIDILLGGLTDDWFFANTTRGNKDTHDKAANEQVVEV